MATYKEIHGVKVQYRDSDATAIEGDVWYNASTGLLKMYAALGSWATGGDLNNARTCYDNFFRSDIIKVERNGLPIAFISN